MLSKGKTKLNSSKAGDIVCDIFMGSGSSLIACEKTKRTCYGIELDPLYCGAIIKRWEDFTGKKSEQIK
jgi:DNA modification methylase